MHREKTIYEYREKPATYKPRGEATKESSLPMLGSQTFSLQNCEKLSICFFKPPESLVLCHGNSRKWIHFDCRMRGRNHWIRHHERGRERRQLGGWLTEGEKPLKWQERRGLNHRWGVLGWKIAPTVDMSVSWNLCILLHRTKDVIKIKLLRWKVDVGGPSPQSHVSLLRERQTPSKEGNVIQPQVRAWSYHTLEEAGKTNCCSWKPHISVKAATEN